MNTDTVVFADFKNSTTDGKNEGSGKKLSQKYPSYSYKSSHAYVADDPQRLVSLVGQFVEAACIDTLEVSKRLQELRNAMQTDPSQHHWISHHPMTPNNRMKAVIQSLDSSYLVHSFTAKDERGYSYHHNSFKFVPPGENIEIKGKEWYEHGILREWHERRRRKGLQFISPEVHKYERINKLVPSYETNTDVKATSTPTAI